jgi:hypothetical protein
MLYLFLPYETLFMNYSLIKVTYMNWIVQSKWRVLNIINKKISSFIFLPSISKHSYLPGLGFKCVIKFHWSYKLCIWIASVMYQTDPIKKLYIISMKDKSSTQYKFIQNILKITSFTEVGKPTWNWLMLVNLKLNPNKEGRMG